MILRSFRWSFAMVFPWFSHGFPPEPRHHGLAFAACHGFLQQLQEADAGGGDRGAVEAGDPKFLESLVIPLDPSGNG